MMYAVWMIYFTIFKVVTFHESQAIPFGVIASVALFLATRPSARAYTR